MKKIRNEKGVALVMVLVLSLIGLAIVSALLFMATQGTKMSGYYKFFRTADEAGISGVETTADFMKNVIQGSPDLTPGLRGWGTVALTADSACLFQKLNVSKGWGTFSAGWSSCSVSEMSLNAASNADFSYQTNPSNSLGIPNFAVFSKIVDTVRGNTGVNTGGPALRTRGVVSGDAGEIYPQTIPDLYRIEVQAQDAINPREVSRYSLLYAR